MNKGYAFLFAFLVSGLIFSNIFLFKTATSNAVSSLESSIVARVIDGDTIKLEDGRTLRLININSPEKGKFGANLSKEFLLKFENDSIEIESVGIDKYQRTLARIYSNGEYLNLKIVRLGLASKFLVQDSELSDFSEAEEIAIEEAIGIWKKSSNYGCISSKIYKNEELVQLENECPNLNFNKWFLKDESRKTYQFDGTSFEKITLHSSLGEDNSTDLFWDSKDNIWNSDRDTLYLFDSEGGLVHYETYGY